MLLKTGAFSANEGLFNGLNSILLGLLHRKLGNLPVCVLCHGICGKIVAVGLILHFCQSLRHTVSVCCGQCLFIGFFHLISGILYIDIVAALAVTFPEVSPKTGYGGVVLVYQVPDFFPGNHIVPKLCPLLLGTLPLKGSLHLIHGNIIGKARYLLCHGRHGKGQAR